VLVGTSAKLRLDRRQPRSDLAQIGQLGLEIPYAIQQATLAIGKRGLVSVGQGLGAGRPWKDRQDDGDRHNRDQLARNACRIAACNKPTHHSAS
jgi:hypothetical protein